MTQIEETYQKKAHLILTYHGCPGAIQRTASSGFRGAAAPPEMIDKCKINVFPLFPDEIGICNPIGHHYEGSLQIDITTTKEGYRELARYLLAFSELDITANPDHHEHHDIVSADNKTQIKLIFRKTISDEQQS